MGQLEGRTALVTGAGDGIGAGVARAYGREGALVGVSDISAESAERVAKEIEDAGGRAVALEMDVSDRAAVDAGVATLSEASGGPIHIVVNNAGIIRPAMFPKLTEDKFRQVIDVHLMGSFFCSQAALPHIPDDGTGRIICVVSAAGLTGTIGQANYGSAKAALVGLTKSMAKELARRKITANVIAPLAATAMTETIRTDERFKEQTLARIPLARWADPEEIAHTFVFFASDGAAYITGQVLPVDGGMVM